MSDPDFAVSPVSSVHTSDLSMSEEDEPPTPITRRPTPKTLGKTLGKRKRPVTTRDAAAAAAAADSDDDSDSGGR